MADLAEKFRKIFSKASSFLEKKIQAIFGNSQNEENLSQLRKLLYEAELGRELVEESIEEVHALLKKNCHLSPQEIFDHIEVYLSNIFRSIPSLQPSSSEPLVILMVGANGSGKTTSIGKLAHHYQTLNKKVLLVAADTFRAGAVGQLSLWAERLNLEIVKGAPHGDPSSVVFDGLSAARSRQAEVVLVDTSGRLHNKQNLMKELEKIGRTCRKIIPDAPQETFLIVDATLGQSGIEQASAFHQVTPLTGMVVTKLDGTAKGGILLPISRQIRVPIRWVGIGESVDDLIPFDPKEYISALFRE